MTTTPTSGAADLPEALHRSTAADGKTELFNLPGYPLMVRAVDFNRLHTESEMRRTALLDEMQKAALAAGQATAAQPAPATQQAGEYPALVCDYCGALTPDPWHSSGMLHGKMSKHIHSCDACAARGAAKAQVVVQDDLITIRKPTTSAEMLWLLKLAHLVISDVDKTLEKTFAPTQPAVEASRFGSPELQAMIIARCVEKDQADSVQEDAALWHWLAEYLVGPRTDLDDEIVASETVNDLRKLVKAAIKQGEKQ